MPDAGEYIFTPDTGDPVVFDKNTASEETSAFAELVFFSFLGLVGESAIKLFESGGLLTLSAWLHEADEETLRTAMSAIATACRNASVGTLSIRGAADSWPDTVIHGPARFVEHYPFDDLTATVGCRVLVNFKQLVPTT